MLPEIDPINRVLKREPFDSSDWVFETKFDGFRGIAYVEGGECRLVSRRGHAYKRFESLRKAITAELRAVSRATCTGELLPVLHPCRQMTSGSSGSEATPRIGERRGEFRPPRRPVP